MSNKVTYDNEIEIKFLKNLIKLRKANGLTQHDLASKSGLTQQAVSSMERGDRKPTLPNIIKYLSALNIDLNEIFQ